MTEISEFIKTYWTYFVAFATVMAYLFDKGYTLWTDKKKKQQAYNRTFTSVVKLYYSYLKHKKIYSEETPGNFPEEIYVKVVKHLNSFNDDLDEFKNSVLKESEIIPEISIQAHMLFDTIERTRVLDKMKLAEDPALDEISEKDDLAVKRAQFYAMGEIYDEFFTDIITEMRKHTTVKKEFVERLFYFKSSEYEKEAEKEQKRIMIRYFESLNRQGVLPDEVFDYLMTEMNLKETENNDE